MKNIAEFAIVGRIGNIEIKDNVAFISIAANYRRKVGDDWQDDPHWNRVTLFGKNIDLAGQFKKGDLVSTTGRIRQASYERNGETVYGVDLIAHKLEPGVDG